MDQNLRELYQEIILDHSRHPRHFGALASANHMAEGHNPLCGDRVKVYLQVDATTASPMSASKAAVAPFRSPARR
jgi:nitrogen fixation NifU-like protein